MDVKDALWDTFFLKKWFFKFNFGVTNGLYIVQGGSRRLKSPILRGV